MNSGSTWTSSAWSWIPQAAAVADGPWVMRWQWDVLVLLGLAFAVFLVRHAFTGRTISARIQKQGGSPLLGTLPMEFTYWMLRPIGDLASKLKLSPNLFSFLCLALGFASGAVAAAGAISAAGALSMISAMLDALDGMVARKRGVASDAGEVLDATIDRYAEFFLLGGLAIHFRFSVPLMVLTLAALMGSLMVSYTQAKAEAMNVTVPKGWMRRPERAAYLGAGTFFGPLFHGFWDLSGDPRVHGLVVAAILLVAVLSNIVAVQRVWVMYNTIKKRERKSR